MDPKEDSRSLPRALVHQGYDDPHFHDEEPEPSDDTAHTKAQARKPARRIPPPRSGRLTERAARGTGFNLCHPTL